MRIAYFVHGRGRGHASRTRAIVRALREQDGHHVKVFAGGDALDLLGSDPDLVEAPPVMPGSGVVGQTRARLREDRPALRLLSPELIVSDGDMPGLLHARRLGIPSVAVGHDLVFSHCRLPPGLPTGALVRQRINAAHLQFADHGVAVHFLPITPSAAGVRCARPTVAQPSPTCRREEHIVAYFRDPNAGEVLEALARTGRSVLAFGYRGAVPRGVTRCPFDAASFRRALASCHSVVGSAGSNLLAECIQLGRPILALHAPRDAEQRMNAAMLTHSGAGHGMRIDRADPDQVRRFLRHVDDGLFRTVDLSALRTTVEAMRETVEQVELSVGMDPARPVRVRRAPAPAPRAMAVTGMAVGRQRV